MKAQKRDRLPEWTERNASANQQIPEIHNTLIELAEERLRDAQADRIPLDVFVVREIQAAIHFAAADIVRAMYTQAEDG